MIIQDQNDPFWDDELDAELDGYDSYWYLQEYGDWFESDETGEI
jgi:hypothetical protein